MSDSRIGGAILCAGLGTRMKPFTDVLPKPLIPFLNTPIVSYPLSQLTQLGVRSISINLHHLPDAIPPVVDRIAQSFGMPVKYAHEWELLGSGGGMIGLATTFDDDVETLVFMNGDTVLDIDLAPHVEAHEKSGAAVTLVVRPKVPEQPGRVFVDDGEVVKLRDYQKPSSAVDGQEYDFLGVHIVKASLFRELEVEACDIIDAVYGPLLEDDGLIGASIHDGFFAALDSPELLYNTSVDVLTNPEQCGIAPLPTPLREGLYVYRPGAIASAADVAPPVLVGASVEVGANATIGPNVVCDGVTVGQTTTIQNAVIYGMGDIEGEWRDCVAIAGQVVQLTQS